MESYVFTPTNAEERNLVKSFTEKGHVPVRILTDEEKEDMGFGLLMQGADPNERASREEIMRKLSR